MPLGTLDRTAPPLFNQGPSALSKLIFFSALALFLMVADARFNVVQPIRTVVGAVLFPVQWVAMQPVLLARAASRYVEDLQGAQRDEAQARRQLAELAQRASRADTLSGENARLRALLELRQTTQNPSRAAEVLFDAADPYTRKIVIDQGINHGIVAGSPVIDENGVLGQVTQVLPFTSEVTLVIDRDLSVPVQNTRTGVRTVAFGDVDARGGGLELRYMTSHADLQVGDVLATSGVDGVYPAGLPVARIDNIERRADSAFARVHGMPFAAVTAARYVLVLAPVGDPVPQVYPGSAGAATAATADVAARKKPEKADTAKKGDASAKDGGGKEAAKELAKEQRATPAPRAGRPAEPRTGAPR